MSFKKILFTEEDIQKRVKELGQQITRDYHDKDLMVIGILKGSVIYLADLLRNIDTPVLLDFMSVSSYQEKSYSNGEVRVLKDLDYSVEGKDVLIVEDIIDSGYTLKYLLDSIKLRGASSVNITAFLDKKECRKVDVDVKYVGYTVENEFIVGYGLDYNESYRNLPYLAALKEEMIIS